MGEFERHRVLVVEDDPTHLNLIAEAVRTLGVEVDEAVTAGSALTILESTAIDIVLLDVALPDFNGFQLHRCIRGLADPPDVVFVTANDLVESGVTAVLDGAANYVVKRPNYLDVIVRVVGGLLEPSTDRSFPPLASDERRRGGLIGESEAINRVRSLIDEFGRTDSTVLICGETGTGKELVARSLHERSARRERPFVVVNCAAIPEALVESELFGARRGSYTGSHHDRRGVVGEAERGTLFLDEIGELSIGTQAKLLRLLENGRYRQVGGTGDLQADVRFIAATNRDLRADVRAGRFRRDLYFRVDVLRIDVPPLRERRCDIPLLVNHFVSECHTGVPVPYLHEEAWNQLMAAPWPGNVRELRHAVHRTMVRWRGGGIHRFEVDLELDCGGRESEKKALSRERLISVLGKHGGQLGLVAAEFKVSVRTIQRRVREYSLDVDSYRPGTR